MAGLAMVLLAAGLGGCAGAPEMEGMPADIAAAPRVVQDAYLFAAAHPDVLTQIPCYCGCGAIGHASNYACYISDVAADGTITYDSHALGCSICVDITRDTMRLLDEGRSVVEIRAEIDATYSAFGPSNMP
jgi:hypothetical protein